MRTLHYLYLRASNERIQHNAPNASDSQRPEISASVERTNDSGSCVSAVIESNTATREPNESNTNFHIDVYETDILSNCRIMMTNICSQTKKVINTAAKLFGSS